MTATNDTINALTVHHGLDDYANMIWIDFGATGPREVTDTWHGDSSTKLFPVTYPNPENVVSGPPTVLINDVTKPVAVWGVDTGYDWYWRASDAALIQDAAHPGADADRHTDRASTWRTSRAPCMPPTIPASRPTAIAT